MLSTERHDTSKPRTPAVACLALIVAMTAVAMLAPVVHSQAPRPAQPGIAYLALDLQTGQPLEAERATQLDLAVAPGSLIKIATLAAALEAGAVTARTGLLCTRETRVAGHTLVCAHPDLQRPLRPAEALAHSCNTFFTTVAARTPRSVFDRVLTDLGLPTTNAGVPLAAAGVGVEGIRVAPRRLIEAMAKIAEEPSRLPWRAETLAVVREGLRAAATTGSARALGDRGISALAKTGTVIENGVAQGFVVGVTPATRPTVGFAIAVSGGAGVDAAALAADRLAKGRPREVRVGVARRDGGYDVRTLPLDDYVAGVVAGEAAADSSDAALDALAITVRTYTEGNRRRHEAEGFDLCDLTHCQVMRKATPATTRSATRTTGQVLLDRGMVARVFYTASCGGHTETPSRVWNGAPDLPHLQARPDPYCEARPAWTSELRAADIQRALRAGGFRGETLRNLAIVSRTSSGRVAWLRADGLVPPDISGDDFRMLIGRSLGWQHVRSTLFDLRRTGSGFRFDGRGAGHGVGLCVVGSAALARTGRRADDILAEYFPGTRIGQIDGRAEASTPVKFVLPPSLQREEAALRRLVDAKLRQLTAAFDVASPRGLTLRFHPTVESYERESGSRWFTAATTRGMAIDFIPLPILRERDITESTIAHELVHVLTADAVKDRPRWVAEGLAAYFAGEFHAVGRQGACPDDAEMSRPSSGDSLKRALSASAACVAEQLKNGRTWRDVGR